MSLNLYFNNRVIALRIYSASVNVKEKGVAVTVTEICTIEYMRERYSIYIERDMHYTEKKTMHYICLTLLLKLSQRFSVLSLRVLLRREATTFM